MAAESAEAESTPAIRAVDIAHALAFRTGLGNSLFAPAHTHAPVSAEDVQAFAASAFTAGNVAVLGSGIMRRLVTTVFFPDAAEANAADPVLSLIEQPHRRDTLIARGADGHYHFDIHLQGDKETVFLDV